MTRYARWAVVAALIFTAVYIYAAGLDKQAAEKPKAKDDIYAEVELFADAVSAVRSDYVEEVESKKLMYGAMSGMLGSLDDYSQFMEPDEYKEIQVETKGQFGGIGIEISMRDGIVTVVTPIAGTPAEAAGLRPGDRIVKIDGKITRDLKIDDAVNMMRGRPGTTVTLTIWRDKDVFDVPVKRDMIQIHSVKKAGIIDDRIGYIKLVEFQENTAKDLDDALQRLGSHGMDALILDLRNNPGGLLDGAIDVAERFLPKEKVIVSIRARDPKLNETFKSSGRFFRGDYPLVLLVSGGSASASEIVAGAIKDNRRGIVLGTKTYGKASVQTVIPLKDGSALRLTTALYVTPAGTLIKGEGVTPDVVVERETSVTQKVSEAEEIFDSVERPNQDAGHPGKSKAPVSGEGLGDIDVKSDNQLAAAVNLLKALRIYKAER
jgi:carboxyl-terminal processing protease